MCIDSANRFARRQAGLTMIELVLFILIVSIAVVAILQVMNLTTRNSADPQRRKQALAIAEAMLEEVESAHFTYCDPTDPVAPTATDTSKCTIVENWGNETSGASRPYDNVNDYVSAAGTPVTYSTDAIGNDITAGGYSTTVTISPDAGLGPTGSQIASGNTPATMNALKITVTVSYDNQSITLDGYRTRYAPQATP